MKTIRIARPSQRVFVRFTILILTLTLTAFFLPHSPSVAADTKTRTPRSLSEIPRPSELALGLAQIQYRGYFADDPNWFSNERYEKSLILNTTVGASGIPDFDWYSNPADWNKVEKSSWSWTGHFIPDVSGEWQFEIASDDASFMWLGNDAVTNYQGGPAGALIKNGGIHEAKAVSAKIMLTKDKIYPLRIQYGNNGQAAVFKFRFMSPGVTEWQSDFSTLLWRAAYGSSAKACGNFGLSYSLSLELGYGDPGLAEFCKNNGADPKVFKHNWINTAAKAKPQVPSVNNVKITTSGLVIEVALGSVPVSSVYLLSPVLGFSNTAKLIGKISNSTATFLIPTAKLKKLTEVDFNIFSSNSNGTTSTNQKAVPIPSKLATPVAKPSVKPTPPTTASLICSKGDKTRSFTGKVCPPGWTK
jgi:hypothetical protein